MKANVSPFALCAAANVRSDPNVEVTPLRTFV
jgi:hypothetical protein